jgi:Adenylate cyclase, family 3 (some proteins contain HAMP domain)
MCAGGLPVANNTNAFDIVRAALEIQQFMLGQMQQSKKDGKEMFEVRIGVHTGPVVAGIVGLKKFAYDIWGDTVNIASRMESSGEAGKVNISGATYEMVKDKFNCTHRGKIEAKHKGEIDMYFVELRTIQFHSDNKTPPIITSLLVPEG